eukprot:6212501-Pleurochrysis_carterae.AAC.1
MTVAVRLYLMSYEDGVCGTKGLLQRQVTYRVGLIRSYDINPTRPGLPKGWGSLSDNYLKIRFKSKSLPEDSDCRGDEAWARISFVIKSIWTWRGAAEVKVQLPSLGSLLRQRHDFRSPLFPADGHHPKEKGQHFSVSVVGCVVHLREKRISKHNKKLVIP